MSALRTTPSLPLQPSVVAKKASSEEIREAALIDFVRRLAISAAQAEYEAANQGQTDDQ